MKNIKKNITFVNENLNIPTIPTEDELLDILKSDFKDYTKPNSTFPVEVKDKKGNVIKVLTFHIDADGELNIKNNMNESNKFTKTLAALCLIGGTLTSCMKIDGHFGYNLGAINKNSLGLVIKRPLTPTEAYVMRMGISKANNVSIADTEIDSESYSEYDAKYDDCRMHSYWKTGLEKIKDMQMNVDSITRKADSEAANQTWFVPDNDARDAKNLEYSKNPILITPININELYFMKDNTPIILTNNSEKIDIGIIVGGKYDVDANSDSNILTITNKRDSNIKLILTYKNDKWYNDKGVDFNILFKGRCNITLQHDDVEFNFTN